MAWRSRLKFSWQALQRTIFSTASAFARFRQLFPNINDRTPSHTSVPQSWFCLRIQPAVHPISGPETLSMMKNVDATVNQNGKYRRLLMGVIDSSTYGLRCQTCKREESHKILDKGSTYGGSNWQNPPEFSNFRTTWRHESKRHEPELISAICVKCKRAAEKF